MVWIMIWWLTKVQNQKVGVSVYAFDTFLKICEDLRYNLLLEVYHLYESIEWFKS